MKKLVAFAMILTLGLFVAVGCNKPAATKKADEKPKAGATDNMAKPAADAAKPATEEKK